MSVTRDEFTKEVWLWMDTANFSGVERKRYMTNDRGEIENQWIVGWTESRHVTIDDLLSGKYWNATWHLEREPAIRAYKKRINSERRRMDEAMDAMTPHDAGHGGTLG